MQRCCSETKAAFAPSMFLVGPVHELSMGLSPMACLRWSALRLRAPRLPWAKGLGRTLLRIDSIGTKLREYVLLSPLGPEAL